MYSPAATFFSSPECSRSFNSPHTWSSNRSSSTSPAWRAWAAVNGPWSMMARTSSGDFFRPSAIRATRFPYRSSTTLVITSRVSGLMSLRVNMSP
jgi:hypothetical protein